MPVNVPKWWRKRRRQKSLKKSFHPKIFPWLRTIQFWHPWRENFAKRLQIFTLISERDQNEYIIFRKIVFLTKKFLWSLIMQFWQTCWGCFATRPTNYSLDVQKGRKNWKVFQEKFLPKVFLWTHILHFLQRRPPKNRSISEKGKNIALFRKSFSSQKCSQDHVQCSFHNSSDKFFPEGRKFFAHCPKLRKKRIFQKRFVSFFWERSNGFLYTWIAFLQPRQILFARRPILFKIWKWWKNEPSSAEYFYSKCSYDHVKRSFDNLAKKIVEEAGKFSLELQKLWKSQNHSFKTFCQVFQNLKCSSLHVECIFYRPVEKFLLVVPNFAGQCSEKNEENVEVLQKKIFFSKAYLWLRTIRFWQPFR